jgi:hypothetical protein
MSYENKHVFRDGAITLYTRNGKPIYHCRLKLDGHRGYIVKSTKKTELVEAARVANDLYDDLRYKVRHGLEVKPHTFESMWKRWLTSNRNLLSHHRIRYFEGTADRYFLPYFGSMSLEQLSDASIAGYWEWRLNYWSSPQGQERIASAQKTRTTEKRPYKQKLGNVAKVEPPTNSTNLLPVSVDKAPSRTNRTHNNHLPWASGLHHSHCSHRSIGRHWSALSQFQHGHTEGR